MGEWVERVANYESSISPIKAEYNINPSVSGRKKNTFFKLSKRLNNKLKPVLVCDDCDD